jgi:DNA-binding CsgD family transcriptional regulator
MDDCPLTTRELAIVQLLAEGLVCKQIAARLAVSVSTVRSHLVHMYRKLNVADRAQAVLVAQNAGWIKTAMTPTHQLLFDVRNSLHRLEQRLPLNHRERIRLAQFEHALQHTDRSPEADAMLDNLGAVLTFVHRYGTVPARERPRRPTDG